MKTLSLPLQAAAMVLGLTISSLDAAPTFHSWAARPPMGWNSWDCFATTLTEAQAKEHADIMAAKLLPHGWEYLVVDIQWYEPGSTGYDYRAGAKLATDEFGRLLPAENKFPSAKGGAGFRPLSEYVHGKKLKFGIHLMRGIPRQAVEQNLPIKGTKYHAADIADKVNICPWNPDMYGVDMSKPGSQEYYDSVFELIASWGVDYVKVDDLSRPYLRNIPEIEAIRKAIDRTGRPMVLSLSPGETDLNGAAHVVEHANLWRISDDFWDRWSLLESQFKRLDDWNKWRRPGAWPDADMIPFGVIEMGRKTWFTPSEQTTLMTLWAIARCPLMLGADLTKLNEATLALLTNDAVISVNQNSENNRQLFRDRDGRVAWMANVPNSNDVYLALFNARDPWILDDKKKIWQSERLTNERGAQEVKFDVPATAGHTLVLVTDPLGSKRFWWPAVWRDLRWILEDKSEVPAEHDYGSHGEKVNGIKAPPKAVALRGTARLDDAARSSKEKEAAVYSVYSYSDQDLKQSGFEVSAHFRKLNISETAVVTDLWTGKYLGTYKNTFTTEIEWHGARLYRLSPR